MHALLRRLGFARRDVLVVRSRPAGGCPYGEYTLARKGRRSRPYRTLLDAVDPPRGSCCCPDFLRSSLGLCKHLLVVLDWLAASDRRWKRALQAREADRVQRSSPLSWNPVRDLRGPGDWLRQVSWDDSVSRPGRQSRATHAARRWFHRRGEGRKPLIDAFPEDPVRRLRLVRDLRAALDTTSSRLSIDPALEALLDEEIAILEPIRRDRLAPSPLIDELSTLEAPLYPYQRDGVQAFLERGRLLLADDMGLGKTAQAIAAGHILYRRRRVRRGLIIAPSPLKHQWQREWRQFSRTPIEIVDGYPSERAACYARQDRGFLVTSYELMLRDLELVMAWDPEFVVLDEAQRIKNWETKTAATVKHMRPPYRLVLTGTPMENRLDELASIVEWVDDRALEPKWRLVPWHTAPPSGTDGARGGARNLDTLRVRLAGILVRRRRAEVLEQLPPRTDTLVPIEMTASQRNAHDELDLPIARLAATAADRPLTQAEFLRLMQLLTTQRIISNGLAQLDFTSVWPDLHEREPTAHRLRSLDSPKLLELRELFRQLLAEDRKLVVFSQWRRALQLACWATRDVLVEHGARPAFFTGKEGTRRRTQNLVDFHDDPEVRVLFASDAGGTGLNLQRAASCVVNLELPWNPAVLEQRIGRIYRLGQKRPIEVYNLICDEGIEARITTLVGDKKALFQGLFDGVTDEIQYESASAFMERLGKLVPAHPCLESADSEAEEPDGLDREIEETLAAADESEDDGGDDSPGRIDPGPSAERAPTTARVATDHPVKHMFGQVTLTRLDDGSVRIEAPEEAAATLEALFEGMADLMRRAQGAGR